MDLDELYIVEENIDVYTEAYKKKKAKGKKEKFFDTSITQVYVNADGKKKKKDFEEDEESIDDKKKRKAKKESVDFLLDSISTM